MSCSFENCIRDVRRNGVCDTHSKILLRQKHPEYEPWIGLRQRCNNPNHSRYADYGGRGITVTARWSRFKNFLADMGERPGPEYSIERLDNNKGYYKENCAWVTLDRQANNRRSSHTVSLHGRNQTLVQWCRELELDYSNVRMRLLRGYSVEKAFTKNLFNSKGVLR